MVGGSVNDSEDVWVKGPEKMSADFIYLINNDSFKTVYSALIRTIKKRRYHYDVRRVKGKITGKAFRDDMKCFLGYTYEALVPQDFVSSSPCCRHHAQPQVRQARGLVRATPTASRTSWVSEAAVF